MFQIILHENLIILPELGSQSRQTLTLEYLKDICFIEFLFNVSPLS